MTRNAVGRLSRGALTLLRASALAAPLALFSASPAFAGPPFLTDDPEPVAYHHYELYTFSITDKTSGGRIVLGPALEYNIGALPNVQLHVVLPYGWNMPLGDRAKSGVSDTEIGMKYRFVQQTSSMPEIGIFPMAEIATGNAANGLGNGRTWFRVPLWIQKNAGPWPTYGGGGIALNNAPGMKNYPFAGWLVQRDLSARLTLGGELFFNGASAVGGVHSSYYNVGGYLKPSDHFNVLFSVGHTISGESHAIAYVGLYWTGGPEEKTPPLKP